MKRFICGSDEEGHHFLSSRKEKALIGEAFFLLAGFCFLALDHWSIVILPVSLKSALQMGIYIVALVIVCTNTPGAESRIDHKVKIRQDKG